MLSEWLVTAAAAPGFCTVNIRPATICGYSPRQRLDVIVNILTNHAVINRRIKVLGGDQLRPNIHIDDMVRLYGPGGHGCQKINAARSTSDRELESHRNAKVIEPS
jgi:hypothetical protein